jgi:hypothetical protein
MSKLKVSYFQGNKTFQLFPFDAYIGEVYGKGRKHGYYIQLARGTTNLNHEVKQNTFKTKAKAEAVIRKWIRAKYAQYEAKLKLKQLKKKR